MHLAAEPTVRKHQETELLKTITYCAENSPFYQEVFRDRQIDPQTIQTLEDLQRLPFTSKEDLQERNFDFLCVPHTKVVDYSTTSGTLGDPVIFALTESDLDRLATNERLSFQCADIDENDIIQLTTTIDRRFMAGLAYFLGSRNLGSGMIRVGSGVPELQWDTITKLKPTTLIAVPSFILKLIEFAEQNGIDYRKSSIKKAICIGEPIRHEDFTFNTLGRRITSQWDLKLYSTYASTEMSTAFTECNAGRGGHHQPEMIIVEFIDENDQPVAEGEAGEVVVTTLGVEGMPLIRYRTGDICYHYTDPCDCGRTSLRLGPIIGRKKQMIKYKGTTLYPPALFNLLNDFEHIENYVIELDTSDIGTDQLVVRLVSRDHSPEFLHRIKDRFRAKLRVTPDIVLVSEQEMTAIQLPEQNRKLLRFIDRRS